MSRARVAIAPDSFKGSASARAAAEALARGWRSIRPGDELVLLPMADGGEGTLDAFAAAHPTATRIPATVTGPDDRAVRTEWLALDDGTAVIELAGASGLTLLDPLRPLDAHTIGFGELIAAALDAGSTRLLLGIGGSSSTDGATGALEGLGARFLAEDGRPIDRGNRGLGALERVDAAELRPVPSRGAQVLTDVTNPLLGTAGAAVVFGPQKGASPSDIAPMERRLARLAAVLGGDPAAAGAGAAGGAGFGLAWWGADLSPGSAAIGEALGMPEAVALADLVITGEGRFDAQSAGGKVPSYLAGLATRAGIPIALVAGAIEASTDAFGLAVSLSDLAGSTDAARANAGHWLESAGARLAREAPGVLGRR